MIPIIVDTREKYPWAFADFPDAILSFEKLDTGDYTIKGMEHILTIERKRSVSEIAKNITEDRFWAEMGRAKEIPHRFIICEFGWDDIDGYPQNLKLRQEVKDKIRIRPSFILKKIAEMQVDYKVNVLLCDNVTYAEMMAEKIIKRIWERNK